jgi:hypothetical protein
MAFAPCPAQSANGIGPSVTHESPPKRNLAGSLCKWTLFTPRSKSSPAEALARRLRWEWADFHPFCRLRPSFLPAPISRPSGGLCGASASLGHREDSLATGAAQRILARGGNFRARNPASAAVPKGLRDIDRKQNRLQHTTLRSRGYPDRQKLRCDEKKAARPPFYFLRRAGVALCLSGFGGLVSAADLHRAPCRHGARHWANAYTS